MTSNEKESKNIKDKYVKLDPIEHVLRRPNMYVGSIEEDEYTTWIFDDKLKKMKKNKIKICSRVL